MESLHDVRSAAATPNYAIKGHYLAPMIIVMLTMMVVAVSARFYSRVCMLKSVGWDDWLIVPATIVSVLVNIACLICVPHQWGHHVSAITISHHEFILTRVISWIIQPGFTFGIGVTKLSILLFYTRFASTRRFRIAIYVMITILTLWTIAFICVSFMLCKPLWAYWVYTYKEKAVNGLCSDAEGILYLIHGISNLLFDCIVFALPIPTIWRLRIPRKQKFVLTGMMVVGSLAFYRLVVLYEASTGDNDDLNWYGYDLFLLVCAELDLGIFCASIGAAKPVILKVIPWLAKDNEYQSEDVNGFTVSNEMMMEMSKSSDHSSEAASNVRRRGSKEETQPVTSAV